jgi:hypothetical protein
MSAAERKQLQRAREADQARRLEPLDTKRDRAQALAEQLLASAQDLSAKLAAERNVSITTRDIARYLIGLDGTDHVRAALAGKPVTLPPAPAAENVTDDVTQEAPRSDNPLCVLCFKEATHFYRHKETGKELFCCKDCMELVGIPEKPADNVTPNVTQDDSDDEPRLPVMTLLNRLPHDVIEALCEDLPPGCFNAFHHGLTPEGERIVWERIAVDRSEWVILFRAQCLIKDLIHRLRRRMEADNVTEDVTQDEDA